MARATSITPQHRVFQRSSLDSFDSEAKSGQVFRFKRPGGLRLIQHWDALHAMKA